MFIMLLIDSILPIIVVATIVLIIGFCAYYFNGKRVILRKLSITPAKPMGSLKTNEFTKITGKAIHVKEPLIAPLSKRKCIFYSITIQKRVSTGKSSHWKTIIKEEKIQDFFINNKGDFAMIKPTRSPKNYISYLVTDKKARAGAFSRPTPEFESLLRHYNIDSTNFFGFNKQLKYTEGIIEIGENITVAGIGRWKTLSEPIPEYEYSKIAALESSDKQKLIITDLPAANVVRHK